MIEAAAPLPVRVVLVDDHPVFRCGLRLVLSHASDVEVVGEAANAAEAMLLVDELEPDLAIVDVIMPDKDGVAIARELRATRPQCKILALSVLDEPVRVAEMLRAGASGFALKTQPTHEIVDAIRAVLGSIRYLAPSLSHDAIDALVVDHGMPLERLTAREREVFALLVRGNSNDDIATMLFISPRTVEGHRQRIMLKLEAESVVDLVRVAARAGLSSE